MEYQDLIYESKDKVAYLTLNRPHMRNAFNMNLKHELEDAVSQIEKDETIWGVIITGNGKAFSSGTDISEFPSSVEQARKITAYSQGLFNKVENLGKPVIAAINGFALGGGLELALACDIRIAAESAKLGFPEVKISAIPCYGGTQRLTRLVGAGRAKEIIFTGAMLSASEALAIGLVNHVVLVGKEIEKAEAIMRVILDNAPMAVAYAKLCINKGSEISLEHALDLEQNLVSMLVPTHDLQEGSQAFLEKRNPIFLNR
jgi:enoyl-CoA hydratase